LTSHPHPTIDRKRGALICDCLSLLGSLLYRSLKHLQLRRRGSAGAAPPPVHASTLASTHANVHCMPVGVDVDTYPSPKNPQHGLKKNKGSAHCSWHLEAARPAIYTVRHPYIATYQRRPQFLLVNVAISTIKRRPRCLQFPSQLIRQNSNRTTTMKKKTVATSSLEIFSAKRDCLRCRQRPSPANSPEPAYLPSESVPFHFLFAASRPRWVFPSCLRQHCD
jgi:hypothetical protein